MRSFAVRLGRVVRALVRTPLFTIVAIVTLAVGIAANTAIFSVVYGVLLKPLPFEQPDRLAGVWHTAPGLGFPLVNQGPATYLTYREEGRTFEDIGLWDNVMVAVTGRAEPERVQAMRFTDGLLPVLRVQPVIGRRFTRHDDSPGSADTVMLSYAYWQRKFGGDPKAVGQRLIVDAKPREIIGVLPQRFKFLRYDPALILPFQFNRAEIFVGNFSYQGVARLKPGVTLQRANADVARMLPMVIEKFPLPKGFTRKMFDEIRLGPNVRPLADDVIGDVGQVLWVLLGTVGLVLLIACANVANLFLVRAEGRQQELAVRTALGATRGRIARELLFESVTLGLVAGALAVLLAYGGIRLLVAVAPDGLPRLEEIGINPLVLLFTLGISLCAGVLFGLIPILRFAPGHLAHALKEGGRASSDGRERHRMRNALVIAEVALALVLMVGSGLMIRTFQAMRRVDPGFTRPEEVLTMRISIPEALIKDEVQAVRTHQQIMDRIALLPGVESVGLSSSITMDDNDSNDPVFLKDFPDPSGRMPPIRRFKWTSENYFRTMGNHMVAGRGISWTDIYAAANVVVVSENFARLYWKQPAAALGRRIRTSPTDPWREIVGVVGDERDDGVAKAATPIIYWPMLMRDYFGTGLSARRTMAYAIRSTRLQSPTFLKEIQQAAWSVNPNLPLSGVRTLDEIRAGSMAQTAFALVMLGVAGAVALLLGIVGIYGVIACTAAQRTREIGIRVALGAQQGDVSRLFLRHGLLLTVSGIVLGLGVATALTHVMTSLLFGVSAVDPVTYVAVSVGLGAIALLASYLPARRASRVDPVIALRAEA
jgi:predicted permease